jgi:hypothetical protein
VKYKADAKPRSEDEFETAVRAAKEVFRNARRHWKRVREFVEPTVQLLQREGYYAASVVDVAFDLMAIYDDHVLLGYIAVGDWPSADEENVLRCLPAPVCHQPVQYNFSCFVSVSSWCAGSRGGSQNSKKCTRTPLVRLPR